MSIAETACHASPEQAGLRVENIPFDQIPQQSKLFLDYLRDPIALRRFYPEAVQRHYDLAARRDRVLANYTVGKDEIVKHVDGLIEQLANASRTERAHE